MSDNIVRTIGCDSKKQNGVVRSYSYFMIKLAVDDLPTSRRSCQSRDRCRRAADIRLFTPSTAKETLAPNQQYHLNLIVRKCC